MRPLLRDVFRDAINRAKQLGIWDKLNLEQREALVSRYLLEHYQRVDNSKRTAAAGDVPAPPARLAADMGRLMQERNTSFA